MSTARLGRQGRHLHGLCSYGLNYTSGLKRERTRSMWLFNEYSWSAYDNGTAIFSTRPSSASSSLSSLSFATLPSSHCASISRKRLYQRNTRERIRNLYSGGIKRTSGISTTMIDASATHMPSITLANQKGRDRCSSRRPLP